MSTEGECGKVNDGLGKFSFILLSLLQDIVISLSSFKGRSFCYVSEISLFSPTNN